MRFSKRLLLDVGYCLLVLIPVLMIFPPQIAGQTTEVNAEVSLDGESSLRICSQNLFRFGEKKRKRKRVKQKRYLVNRMRKARCDIVGLQEVVGESQKEALSVVQKLAKSMSKAVGREFAAYVGTEEFTNMRNGFLVAKDIGRVEGVESWHRQSLPKLQVLGPPRKWHRGPLALHMKLPSAAGEQDLLIVTMHLKSKYEHWKDPSGTSYEIERMESAEALRELALGKAQEIGPKTILLVLGDRNSHISSASAHILGGERVLDDFRKNGHCTLTSELTPDCQGRKKEPQRLLALFAHRKSKCREKCEVASFRYRKKGELIDEVYLRPHDLHLVVEDDQSLNIGMLGQFFKGSDHLLLWAELDLR